MMHGQNHIKPKAHGCVY